MGAFAAGLSRKYAAPWNRIPSGAGSYTAQAAPRNNLYFPLIMKDYNGLTTSFTRSRLKPGVTVLAEEEGAPWVKYVHGDLGKGTWTFFGGHDPEDPQHQIGDPPTDLSLHPHSPGYRLILNNVLFPAAKKKELKT